MAIGHYHIDTVPSRSNLNSHRGPTPLLFKLVLSEATLTSGQLRLSRFQAHFPLDSRFVLIVVSRTLMYLHSLGKRFRLVHHQREKDALGLFVQAGPKHLVLL